MLPSHTRLGDGLSHQMLPPARTNFVLDVAASEINQAMQFEGDVLSSFPSAAGLHLVSPCFETFNLISWRPSPS